MSRVHMENHELREMGPDTKGSRTHLDDISQREYEDRAQLMRLGKKPALKRNFSFLTILGFSCAVLVTWEGVLMSFAPGLANGGPGGLVYGFLFVWAGNITGLVSFTRPQYNGQTWQGTLIVWAVVLVAVFINTVVSSLLPKIEGMILVLHIVGFFGVLITLLTFGAQGDASAVFATFRNEGGWPTQGLSFFVGLLGLIFSFAEVQNPSVAVPRSIMGSIFINGLMGLAMVISMLFAATNIDEALQSTSGYPFIEIFFQATGSRGGTAVMASLIIFMTISAVVGVIATTSRMFWAFARDRALPFWRTLSKVDPTTQVPIWAIGVTSLISCLLALINIGSTVVYNALVSLSITGLYSSYLIAASLLLWRRCTNGFSMPDGSSLPALADGDNTEGLVWGPWRVPGVLGIVNNSLACAYLVIMWFFTFWPPALVYEAKDMNFSVLMTGFVVIFSIVYYLVWAKKDYKGPIREI
ncbi:Choline transport protein [Beauveria bassiana]|uniref:Choline transport protein n=1 Tax=Beauveria bassiana TaxID=176275 RepID=A0A2N6NZ72_BEABA|nr:Choline transport protein [Beauveria bassiana]